MVFSIKQYLGGFQDTFVTKLSAGAGALVYSTYLGGSDYEQIGGLALDSSGAAYVTGTTYSTNFPTVSAYQAAAGGDIDAFLAKLNGTGGVVFSTYLGGTGGEFGIGIAVDGSGRAYVTGSTTSNNFPSACQAGDAPENAFIVGVDPTGNTLIYYATLGGSLADSGNAIAIDAGGTAAFVAGETQNVFPTTAGAFQTTPGGNQDGFVTKLSLTPPALPTSIAVAGGSPQSTVVNTPFGAPLQVRVMDAGGAPVGNYDVLFTPGPSGSGASANAPSHATTDCNGVAMVNATANSIAGSYEMKSTVNGVSGQVSVPFELTNIAGSPARLTFLVQPTDTPAGSPIVPVTVLVTDASDNPVNGASVTMGLVAGGPLNGPTSVISDSSGKATFPNLSINTVGNYRMQASTVGAAPATSNPFNILGAAAQKITIAGGSGQTTAVNTAFASPLKALVQDAFNNPVPGASVTFAVPSSGASGTFGGSVTVTTDANGFASSPVLTANSQAGPFTGTAGVAGVTPASYALTNVPGTANKLVFVQQPSDSAAGDSINPPVTVQIEDSFGNKVNASGTSITLQLLPSGTVFGTPTRSTDSTGLATFASINVTLVGQYQLLAVASGLTSATSNSFTIRANRVNSLRITGGTP